MPRKRPKIMTMLISSEGFRQQKQNPSKISLALQILDHAKKSRINCVFLPAGFLITSDEHQIKPTLKPILNKAKASSISFILGLDLEEIKRFRSSDGEKMLDAVSTQSIPCLLAHFDSTTGKTHIIRQRSCTSFQAHARMLSDVVMKPRILDVAGTRMNCITCGELYDSRLFQEMAPTTGIVLGHWTMPRLAKSLKSKGRQGFSLLHSEHRTGRGGLLLCTDRGIDKSIRPSSHIEGERGLWAELAAWEIADNGRINPVKI